MMFVYFNEYDKTIQTVLLCNTSIQIYFTSMYQMNATTLYEYMLKLPQTEQ